jgi:hypothetical protein
VQMGSRKLQKYFHTSVFMTVIFCQILRKSCSCSNVTIFTKPNQDGGQLTNLPWGTRNSPQHSTKQTNCNFPKQTPSLEGVSDLRGSEQQYFQAYITTFNKSDSDTRLWKGNPIWPVWRLLIGCLSWPWVWELGGGNCGWWWLEGDDRVQVSDESEKFHPNH